MTNEKKEIAICLIATNKYKQFVQPLIDSIEKNFLLNHSITIHLFTDELDEYYRSHRVTIKQHLIPAYKFPLATLYRYKIFSGHVDEIINTVHAYQKESDYAFYLDVDMKIENEVGDEILNGDLVATSHPGLFFNGGWGSQNVHLLSTAYISVEHWKKYYAGGFQGGKTRTYLSVCAYLSNNIAIDESKSIMAEWHDESHWNAFLNYFIGKDFPEWKVNELSPSYCMVEQMELREKWGIANLDAKIVALAKNHEELRA